MTIDEQVLTLFGGWAEARIPKQTIGAALNCLVTISESHSTRKIKAWEGHTHSAVVGEHSAHWLSVDACRVTRGGGSLRYQYPDYESIDWYEDPEDGQTYGGPHYDRNDYGWLMEGLVLHLLRPVAAVRFVELWGYAGFTQDDFVRGLKGTPKLRQSFAGMIGLLNSMSGQAVEKRSDGKWYVTDKDNFYPNVARLPSEGVQTARKIANKG